MSETRPRWLIALALEVPRGVYREIEDRLREEVAAAEERGRRRGVEEAAKWFSENVGRLDSGMAAEVTDEMRAALAPRDPHASEGPPCAECGHPKWQHQYGSKEHAFCCQQVDGLQLAYCSCKNYLAPRDSGKEPVRDSDDDLRALGERWTGKDRK